MVENRDVNQNMIDPIIDDKASRLFWTLKELAQHCSVAHETITKMLREPVDPLPAVKMGRRWLFEPVKVMAWMKRRARRCI